MMEIFKKAEIYGSLASVYHGSEESPEKFVKIWKSEDFAPGLGAGNKYGPGIYCVYQKAGSATVEGEYGSYIYKFIVNISDYLILDEAVFSTVHPRDANLPYNEKLKLQFKKFNISWNEEDEEIPKVQPEFTSDIAEIIKDNGIHQGLIFTGRNDGNVCIIFNPYSARMVGYSSYENEVRFGMEEIRENNITKEPLKREGYTEEERWRYLANSYAKNKLDSFFDYFEKIKAILGEEETKRIALSAAERLAKNNPFTFFDDFDKIKKLLGEAEVAEIYLPIVKEKAEQDPAWFLSQNLYRIKTYLGEYVAKEAARSAAQSLFKNRPDYFFSYFDKIFDKIKTLIGEDVAKELALSAAKSLAENNPDYFFSYYFDKIQDILGEAEAKEVTNLAAENLIRENPINFFLFHLDKIRNVLEADKIKGIVDDAVKNLAKDNPELFSEIFSNDYFLEKIQAALGKKEADKLKEIAKPKETTASSKIKRFNKIARYLRLAKIG